MSIRWGSGSLEMSCISASSPSTAWRHTPSAGCSTSTTCSLTSAASSPADSECRSFSALSGDRRHWRTRHSVSKRPPTSTLPAASGRPVRHHTAQVCAPPTSRMIPGAPEGQAARAMGAAVTVRAEKPCFWASSAHASTSLSPRCGSKDAGSQLGPTKAHRIRDTLTVDAKRSRDGVQHHPLPVMGRTKPVDGQMKRACQDSLQFALVHFPGRQAALLDHRRRPSSQLPGRKTDDDSDPHRPNGPPAESPSLRPRPGLPQRPGRTRHPWPRSQAALASLPTQTR